MPFHRSPLLALVLALAGAAGVSMWLSRQAQWEQATPVAGATFPAAGIGDNRRPPKPSPPGWAGRSQESETITTAIVPVVPAPLPKLSQSSDAGAAPDRLTEAEVWSHYDPSPEELAYRAFKVEQQANKELANLLQVLDLDEAQQDRVFAALARGSSYYHPSLQPQGQDGTPLGSSPSLLPLPSASPTATPSLGEALPAAPTAEVADAAPTATAPLDPVLAELTPEQADVYERYTSERDAFWVGVVEDVEQELNAR